MTRTTTLLLCLAAAVTLGCATEETIAPTSAPTPAATAKQKAAEPVAETLESPNVEIAAVVAEVADQQPDKAERFLILARGGPLLLDVSLTIDGRPYDQGLAALIERVLSAADTDGDGRSSWSEWRVNRQFLDGELANLRASDERQVRQWVERFDENDDNQMQPAEAASWLGRGSGRRATALALRSSRAYLTMASSHSRIWQLLDADGDRQLSTAELDLASRQLLLLDTDDDRMIVPAELATLRDQLEAQNAQSQNAQRRAFANRSTRLAAIHLKDRSETSRLDYVLGDLYAPRQQLGPTSFSARGELFAKLDKNGNQQLDTKEFAALAEVEPHAKVSVDFISDGGNGRPATTLAVLDHGTEIDQVIQHTVNRLVLITSDTRLILSAHDLGGEQRPDQVAQRNQIRMMVHDRGDGLFEALDSDANGKLGEREIATAADRLRRTDTNGDGQLDEDELSVSMTVAFMRSEPPSERSFYVPSYDSVAMTPSNSTPTSTTGQQTAIGSWFQHADFNGDGDVSRGEFVGSIAQFSSLDRNEDGFISGDEAVTAKAQ